MPVTVCPPLSSAAEQQPTHNQAHAWLDLARMSVLVTHVVTPLTEFRVSPHCKMSGSM